ncbi:reverse transcriptase [Penaeus vannamei]|uniref:RNA-directed DNA polymerase n=1 Tax=Penaeus vannamei TaxID=6689 RepID=A0A3R7MRG5_PENVA|nr:reverse transcriptase [Penaeus vannamei]
MALIHRTRARTHAAPALVSTPLIYTVLPRTCAFKNILQEFPALTKPVNRATQPRHEVRHHIVTHGPPAHSRCRPLAPDRCHSSRAEFDHMMQLGIIRPSSSQWAAPLHLVKKKDGDWRPCGDYRHLTRSPPPTYPCRTCTPSPMNCLAVRFFSRIDLVRAFHQIPIAEEDIPKTAVITPFGLFEFLRMPFGLRNAAQTFQRFINVTRGLEGVFAYIDDILVASTSEADHAHHLRALFGRLQDAGVVINPGKCQFGVASLSFLGHTITPQGITPAQVTAIIKFPRPAMEKQLRKFLGMVNFYRKFVPGIAVDASDTAIGAVLQQRQGKQWQPLAFFSQTLSPRQSRYSAFGRELLAAYSAFTTDIRHIRGSDNEAADALSRVTISAATLADDAVDYHLVSREQRQDTSLTPLLEGQTSLYLERVKIPNSCDDLLCDVSLGYPRPYIPPSLRRRFFDAYHQHRGIRATQHLIRSKVVWPAINKDVRQWCRSCIECQRNKIHRHTKSPSRPFLFQTVGSNTST